jgi:hypothetical protein
MKRMSILLAYLVCTLTSSGCGCCGSWFRNPTPVAAACPPAPGPVCDPCTTAPVTYGTAPVAPYTPPPQF